MSEYPRRLLPVDSDGDRHPDLIGWGDWDVFLLVNTGSGRFSPLTVLFSGTEHRAASGAALGRLPAEGPPDLVITHQQGLSILSGHGYVASRDIAGPGCYSPNIVDLDGDGDDDLLVVSTDAFAEQSALVPYINDGHSNFELGQPLPMLGLAEEVLVTDLAGDGNLEAIVSDGSSTMSVYALHDHNGISLLQTVQARSDGLHAELGWTLGDITNDARLDIVTNDKNAVWVAVQNPAGLFDDGLLLLENDSFSSAVGQAVLVDDLNLDALPDVAAYSSGIWTLVQGPPSMFTSAKVNHPTAASDLSEPLATADFDCDGCKDVVGSEVGGLSVFLGSCAAE